MRSLVAALLGIVLLASAALSSPPPATVAIEPRPGGSQRQVRSLAVLADRQDVGVRFLAAVSKALPDLLWISKLTLGSGSATLAGRAWSASSATEFRDRLEKTPTFGPPKLGAVRDGDDGYSAYSITLEYLGPALGPAAPAEDRDLLKRVAPRDEIPKVQSQIRAALKDLQVKVKDYRSGSKPLPNGPVDLWPVSIQLEGATFTQVALLLDRISRIPRLVVLEELRTEARDKDHPGLAVSLDLSLATAREAPGKS